MKQTCIADIGEFELINVLTAGIRKHSSVVCGVGDDCAVLTLDKTRHQLFATDLIVENVHFRQDSCNPAHIGHKALARNISDIAAMGGMPSHAVVAFGMPKTIKTTFIKKVFKGIKDTARTFNMNIVGGDCAHANVFFIAISILGTVPKTEVVYRRGARLGDVIYATGTFGGSLKRKHLAFTPRVAEARYISSHFPVHSMIDVSDGLAQDLRHILQASNTGAVLDASRIPVSADATKKSKKALKQALFDGEDYELIFTVSERVGKKIERGWRRRFNVPLTPIGHITKESGLYLQDNTGKRRIGDKGYRHF